MRSLERYPLPVTSEKEACALEGVGSFTARRMLRGLSLSSATPAAAAGSSSNNSSSSNRRGTSQDEENIEPTPASSSSSSTTRSRNPNGKSNSTRGSSSVTATASRCSSSNSNGASILRMNLRPDGASGSHGRVRGRGAAKPLSLASNFAALRGDVGDDGGGVGGGAQTPDVTPKRPTSRARREEVGDGAGLSGFYSKAPRFFSGEWEAWLIVDNREHDFMSMQVSLVDGGL